LFLSSEWSSDVRILKLSEFKEPLKLQNGWLLWSGIGLFVAIVAIALAGAVMTFLNGETPQREVYHFYATSTRTSLLLSFPF
jgi:hypothetical protein